MADNKKMVEAITSMDEDFAQWYTDVVKKAELADYAGVRGCMIVRPYGYRASGKISGTIWTPGSRQLGHENVDDAHVHPRKPAAEGKGSCGGLRAGGGVGHPRRQ